MENVLLIGYLTDLLEKRKKCLEHAGYEVTCATSSNGALRLVEGRGFSVVIFGQGIPENERTRIARRIKQVNPATKLIMLYLASIKNAELADAIIHATADPFDLVHIIDELAGRQSRRMSGT